MGSLTTTIEIPRGDLLPSVLATITDVDGVPIDLTAAAAVTMRMWIGAVLVVDRAVTIVDAVGGRVRFDWAAGETDIEGRRRSRYRIEWPGARIQSVPTRMFVDVHVTPDAPT